MRLYTLVAVLHRLGCTVAGVRLDSDFDWRISRLPGNRFFYTPVSLLGAIPCVVNCDAVGSLAGPVAGVGRLTRQRAARPLKGVGARDDWNIVCWGLISFIRIVVCSELK